MSAALHGAALAALWPAPAGRPNAAQAPPIEVELVQEPAATAGAAPDTPSPAMGSTDPAEPEPDGVKPARPLATQAAPALAAVRLGDSNQSLEGLSVTGEHVVPPRPDAAYRNRPPRYPIEAARRGEAGTVGLLIHVSAQGVAEWVQVGLSSGSDSLDRAAAEAVRLWHFNPATDGDRTVPFDYELNINFVRGDRR